jgi:hypothetical protein
MSDPSDEQVADEATDEAAPTESASAAAAPTDPDVESATEEDDLEALRQEVEEKYDFENFGPDQMDEMSAEEWEAAFDPDSWITGEELLDRIERDLKHEIAVRNVFARVERLKDGKIIAYSDQGYATVHPDGSVEGVGTVLRDVKPIVALCSMESYDVPEEPTENALPEPTEVPEGSGELGNLMLQAIAAMQVVAGLALLGAWIFTGLNIIGLVAGLGFLLIGIILFVVVANARLSDRFRAEEYRNRLRAVGVESGERPDFLPVEDDEWVGDAPEGKLEGGNGPSRDSGGSPRTTRETEGNDGEEGDTASDEQGSADGNESEPETAS